MCSTPKVPDAPPPPPPKPQPQEQDAAVTGARDDERRARQRLAGRQSTILTGGSSGAANTASRTLLGG